jgi:hypothetical protein
MKTLSEALKEYKLQHPGAYSFEIDAFIHGWTAHEVAVLMDKNN